MKRVIICIVLLAGIFSSPLSVALADSLAQPSNAATSKDLSGKVSIFISPIAYFAARPNVGVRFPVADLQWPIPLSLSLGLKATYYPSGYETESTLGCESCSAPSWRTRGFEVGPQLYLSTKARNFGLIDSFELRLAAYMTQSLNLPPDQDRDMASSDGTFSSYNSQDSIKGISFEAMVFANVALGNLFFANAGAGLISEPHHLTNTGALDGVPAQQKEYQTAAVIELNLGLSFP